MLNVDGSFTPPSDRYDTLVRNADGSYDLTMAHGSAKYHFDPSGLLRTLTDQFNNVLTYTYDANSRLQQIADSSGSGRYLNVYYGGDGRVSSIVDNSGRQIGFTYESNGTLASVTDPLNRVTTYGYTTVRFAPTNYYYDPLYQLTRADYANVAPFSGASDTWSYDAIGNRLTNTANGTTANYTYHKLGSNPNNWQRLFSDGTNSYSYDANGNTASRTGYTFGWDYENRMNSTAGTPNATYTSDYSGRRSSKTVSGATTTDLYDGLNLIAETTSGSPTCHLFGPAIDEPLASSNTASVIYDAVDALGSIALSAEATGNVQNSDTYNGWGASRSSSESIPQPFRYTSREVGDATGQLFYRARFLTPSIGRFLSEDALVPNIQSNAYRYTLNRPTMRVDPVGLNALAPAQCSTTDCSVYLAGHRKDLYFLCSSVFPFQPKENCVRRQCLQLFFDQHTRPIGAYTDPPVLFSLTVGPVAAIANGIAPLYGPVTYLMCCHVCHYGSF